MNVVILTSSIKGTASHHLEYLLKSEKINIAMVIYSKGEIKNKKKYYKNKIKKLFKIGLFGALNGIRMRKWYGIDTEAYLHIENLEKICSKNQIAFKEVPSINCEETISYFKEANTDIGLSLGNGYIGSKIFTIPKFGMLNIHHEELPKYQNAQSIIWQIYNGSKHTAYTIHKIDKHIDTGEILLQEKIPIHFRGSLSDTIAYNYAQLWEASAKGFKMVLENFEMYYKNATTQGEGDSYTTPKYLEFQRINRQFIKLKKESKSV